MKKLLFFILLFHCTYIIHGQQQQEESESFYKIETTDGNEFIGHIIFQDESNVRIKTVTVGEISILRKDIRSIKRLKGAKGKDGSIWFDNPQAARYFWAPNGYGLKKGEGYYQNIWVFFNQASLSITDNFSIGVGLIPLFLFSGTATPVWITPKFSVPVVEDKLNLGGGALIGKVLGESDTDFGIAYGISTFGSRDRNVSIGLGYGYAGGSWAKAPMVTISGLLRTGKNGYLLTENYYISSGDDGGNGIILSFGGRRIIKRFGLDFGLFLPIGSDMDEFVAVPWLGFAVPF